VRIALITARLPPERGGSETYVADLAQQLARRHETLVLSGTAEADIPGATFIRLPSLPRLEEDASVWAKATWHLQDQWLLSVYLAAREQLRRFRPDVVHTHQAQGLSAATFSAVASEKLPHVHTVHDLNLLCMRVTMTLQGEFCGGRCAPCLLQRTVRRRVIRTQLSCLVAPSDYMREAHVRAGVAPSERAVTIRHGAVAASTRRRSAGDVLRLGFMGALRPHKGIGTLLDAFRSAPASWRLTVAGWGPLEGDVKAAARRDPRIEFRGFVSGGTKDVFLDELDLLVVPSEYEEAATLVAVEAAVVGLPAVVSHRGGLPETPEARVFRARDRSELLAEIAWFAEGDRLASASQRLIERRTEFSYAAHVSKVEDVLEAAAADKATFARTKE
jgi:glycosyltransferase involved in cell wall biosynthesis